MTFATGSKTLYRLMPHVYACARDDYVVLLDIEHGKYLAVNGRHSQKLNGLIEGWPNPARNLSMTHPANPPRGSAESVVRGLVQRGLLTEDMGIGKSAAPVNTNVKPEAFAIFTLDPSLRPNLRYLPRFLLACARAKWLLRNIQLLKIVERIRARRHRWGAQALDQEQLMNLVRAHHHLRPLVYSSHEACLYDSLVLLEFLASYHIDATWVFGIHTWPWIPHCWVRAGQYILNDSPLNVGAYTVLAEF